MVTHEEPEEQVVAIIIGFDTGHEGDFAICRVINDYPGFPNALPAGTSVTFGLQYWKDDTKLSEGLRVVLAKLASKTAGWRAYEARRFRPSDKPAISNQQQRAKEI